MVPANGLLSVGMWDRTYAAKKRQQQQKQSTSATPQEDQNTSAPTRKSNRTSIKNPKYYNDHEVESFLSDSEEEQENLQSPKKAQKRRPTAYPRASSSASITNTSAHLDTAVSNISIQENVDFIDRDLEDETSRTIFCKGCKKCSNCICHRNSLECRKPTAEQPTGCTCSDECINGLHVNHSLENWTIHKPNTFGKNKPKEEQKFGPKNFPNYDPFKMIEFAISQLDILPFITKESNYYRMWREIQENQKQKSSTTNIFDISQANTTSIPTRQQNRDKKKQIRTSEKRKQSGSKSDDPFEVNDEEIDPDYHYKTNQEFYIWMDNQIKNNKEESKFYSVEDIKRYLIICTIMGLLQINADYEKYWNEEETDFGLYGVKVIRKIMARSKFKNLHKYIHFDVDLFEEKLNVLFKQIWTLSSNLSIDEGLLGFRGKCPYQVFIPGKPERFGLKYFCLCDAIGFCFSFFIYKGKNTNRATDSTGIVMEFVAELPKSEIPFTIFADNWYGSEGLAHMLNEANFNFVICCKANRPSYLFAGGLTGQLKVKGDIVARYQVPKHRETEEILNPIVAMAFYDRKKCNFLSNIYDCNITPLSGTKKRPELIHYYNYSMGGVDTFDFGLHNYPMFPHRRNKFTRVCFFGMWKMLFVNLWYCYRYSDAAHQKVSQREFLVSVVKGFLNEWKIDKETLSDDFKHFARRMRRNERRKHCIICRSMTAFVCKKCKVPVHPDCMENFCNKF